MASVAIVAGASQGIGRALAPHAFRLSVPRTCPQALRSREQGEIDKAQPPLISARRNRTGLKFRLCLEQGATRSDFAGGSMRGLGLDSRVCVDDAKTKSPLPKFSVTFVGGFHRKLGVPQ